MPFRARKATVIGATAIAVLASLWPAQGAEIAAQPDAARHLGPSQRGGSGTFTVSLLPLGPTTLSVGMPIAFRVTTSRSGYIHLYALDASGRTQVWLENVRLGARTPYAFPRRGLTIRATPPFGDDTIILAATRRPIDGFAGAGTTLTPFDTQLTHDGFRRALAAKTSALPRSSWSFTETRIRVQD